MGAELPTLNSINVEQTAQADPALVQVQLQYPIGEPIQNGPAPEQNEQNGDPFLASAVSEEAKIFLQNCHQKLMAVTMESCNFCYEEWLALNVTNGKCKIWAKSNKWQVSNNQALTHPSFGFGIPFDTPMPIF